MHFGLTKHTNYKCIFFQPRSQDLYPSQGKGPGNEVAFFSIRRESDNRGKSPWDTNLTNYLCFNTDVWKKVIILKTGYFPGLQYNVENQKILQVSVFNFVWGVGARLGRRGCIRVWRVRKNVKSANLSQESCPWPSKLLSLWLVLSPPFASSSNGLVLLPVWCSLRALMTLKSSKLRMKNYSRKNVWFKNHAKVNAYFTEHEKMKNQFPDWGRKNIDSRITKKNKFSLTFHV